MSLHKNEPSGVDIAINRVAKPDHHHLINTNSIVYRSGFFQTYISSAREKRIFCRFDESNKKDCYSPVRLLKDKKLSNSEKNNKREDYRSSQDNARKMIRHNFNIHDSIKRIVDRDAWYQFGYCSKLYIDARHFDSQIDQNSSEYLAGSKLAEWMIGIAITAKNNLNKQENINLDSLVNYGKKKKRKRHDQDFCQDKEESEVLQLNSIFKNDEKLSTESFVNSDIEETEDEKSDDERCVTKSLNKKLKSQDNEVVLLGNTSSNNIDNIKNMSGNVESDSDEQIDKLLEYLHNGNNRLFQHEWRQAKLTPKENAVLLDKMDNMYLKYSKITSNITSAFKFINSIDQNILPPPISEINLNVRVQTVTSNSNMEALGQFGFLGKSTGLSTQSIRDNTAPSDFLGLNK